MLTATAHSSSPLAASKVLGPEQRQPLEEPVAERDGAPSIASIADKVRTNSRWTSRRIPANKLLLSLNQIAVMTNNGVEIADALSATAAHCHHPGLTARLHAIHEAVSAGNSFANAVAQHGHGFPPSLAPVLAAAEASSNVPGSLTRLVAQMRGRLQMRSTIIGAMVYPAILLGVSALVMSALILGVLPQFQGVFESLGKPVPTSTAYLLAFGEFVKANHLVIGIAIVALLGAAWTLRSSPILRRPLFGFLAYAPLLRGAYRPLSTGQNFRMIASMIQGGVPMLQAVQLTKRAAPDPAWQDLLAAVEEDLMDGKSASETMRDYDFLPPEAAQMMYTGEQTGRIGEVLEDIGIYYEEEATRLLKRIIVTIEPAIILGMGVMVAGIVLSVMLPMLDVTTL